MLNLCKKWFKFLGSNLVIPEYPTTFDFKYIATETNALRLITTHPHGHHYTKNCRCHFDLG